MAHDGSSQRERKRPRLSTDEDEKPFCNHPTLYFDDGNVILGTGRTLFCVHRSLVSKHSTVFRDLFERSHGRFRGLLHVEMEETPEEVEALINVVYDGLRVDIHELTVETFPSLANILRMATKYKLERPCADIVACIRTEWPATLSQHDTKASEARARRNRIYGAHAAGHGPGPEEEDAIVHPASVIALLRECGYTDAALLFPLFYALSCTTWQFGGPLLGHHLAALAPADVERLVVGLERLRAAHFAFAATVPQFPLQATHPPHVCSVGAAGVWAALLPLLVPGLRSARRPLEDWRDVTTVVPARGAENGVCGLCVQAIVARIGAIRQGLWAALPEYFELA